MKTIEIIFLFPFNYKHGYPKEYKHHKESLIIQEDPSTFDNKKLNDLFCLTKLSKVFSSLHFYPKFIEWKLEGNTIGSYLSYTYMALPLIKVFFEKYYLNYFHNPTYKEVKNDFYFKYNQIKSLRKYPSFSQKDPNEQIISDSEQTEHIVSF